MKFSMGRAIGYVIGATGMAVDALQKGTCSVIGEIVDNNTKKSIDDISEELSDSIKGGTKSLSKIAEITIDTPVILAGEISGGVAKKTCELCGVDLETTNQIEQYSKIVGKGLAGYMIGDFIASNLTDALAAPDTVGASEITSGLAGLGGSLAAGISACEFICSTTTLAGALTNEEVPDLSAELLPENRSFMENSN